MSPQESLLHVAVKAQLVIFSNKFVELGQDCIRADVTLKTFTTWQELHRGAHSFSHDHNFSQTGPIEKCCDCGTKIRVGGWGSADMCLPAVRCMCLNLATDMHDQAARKILMASSFRILDFFHVQTAQEEHASFHSQCLRHQDLLCHPAATSRIKQRSSTNQRGRYRCVRSLGN